MKVCLGALASPVICTILEEVDLGGSMKPRLAAAVVIVAVMSIAFAPLAAATTDSPITFVTTTVGGRPLTHASGPTFTTQNLVNAQTADSTAALTRVSEVF